MSEYLKMVNDLVKDPQAIISSMTTTRANLLHAMLGINDELLETLSAVLEDDYNNLLEELGDTLFYLEMLGQELGITVADIQYELENFTIPNVDNSRTLVDLAQDAVTFAKRIGIYCKAYNNADLRTFYVKVHMALREVSLAKEDYLRRAYEDRFDKGCRDYTVREIIEEANMQKLLKSDTARYKSGTYSDEQANARADKAAE
ncbi:hypothetical protein A5gp_00056 [Alteromonas phage vB_AemP_PT15-A5]|nr:hypothetical protein A5gp_00056 [Alteromonas phage vB_AemP_PT15-A5]